MDRSLLEARFTRFTRILNECPRSQWAKELAKLATELKLEETDGKVLQQKVDKLDFVRKSQLIDL